MNVLLKLPGSELADWNAFLEDNNVIPSSRVKLKIDQDERCK